MTFSKLGLFQIICKMFLAGTIFFRRFAPIDVTKLLKLSAIAIGLVTENPMRSNRKTCEKHVEVTEKHIREFVPRYNLKNAVKKKVYFMEPSTP